MIRAQHIELVVFAYSDIAHESPMRQASRVLAAGADFSLLGPRSTMLPAQKPVVSVCATGPVPARVPWRAGSSRSSSGKGWGCRGAAPDMPYGDLAKQAVQRFDSLADLDTAGCTIEERVRSKEPHVAQGCPVYAGVDYGRIVHEAEGRATSLCGRGQQ
ncbi:MAG: hypothetical protein MRJ92_01640 [Nitrospira sp.]|nr:hypothetical protein [Nitrospira sp.]